ncbi:hypothetical protein TWF594_003483 [Orbilia oligospora]|nr:hypothetical protein TWF594_003483 [Orbilia oligospora]
MNGYSSAKSTYACIVPDQLVSQDMPHWLILKDESQCRIPEPQETWLPHLINQLPPHQLTWVQMTHRRPGIPVLKKTFRKYLPFFDIGRRVMLRGTSASPKL